MATKKKAPKVQKVPAYILSRGTKNVRVMFEDGSEGMLSLAKTDPAALGMLPKIDKGRLEQLREAYVTAGVDKLVESFGYEILEL
jgi:hypothetical protein